MIRKPVLLNGKIYNIPAREDFLELTNSLYGVVDLLQSEVNRPQDEKLAKAYAKIEKLREQLLDSKRKSLITLTDDEYARVEAWKREHDECVGKDLFAHRFCLDIKDKRVGMFCSTCGGGLSIR